MQANNGNGTTGAQTVDVVNIVRHEGDGIQLPATLSLKSAVDVLKRKMDEEEQYTNFSAMIPVSPYDGAYAMLKALERKYGYAIQSGGRSRQMQLVVDAMGTTVSVPWGSFVVPGIEGTFATGYTIEDGQVFFQVEAEIRGKYRDQFNQLVELTRQIVSAESIYRGKAMWVEFTDTMGSRQMMPVVKFVDVSNAPRPIFNRDLEEQFDNDVLAYITHADQIRRMRGTLKRGVLLAGPYGTGKTLSAGFVARNAVEHGFTFIYCKPNDLPHALDFAKAYQPAVIFVEDVESVVGIERDAGVNTILNKLDGIDSKRHDILVVCTTNHAEKINRALLRPGRMDAVLFVDPPDQEAALRLVTLYAEKLANEDFTEAAQLMAGQIPAVIAEIVARAQIRAAVRTNGVSSVVTNADLVLAAKSVVRERELLAPAPAEAHPLEMLGTAIGNGIGHPISLALQTLQPAATADRLNGRADH